MHSISAFLLTILMATSSLAQEKEVVVGNFEKIILSPGIDLILTQGNKESVRIEFSGIEFDKINSYVNKNTLMLYLDGAKMKPKQSRVKSEGYNYKTDAYKGARVTAYVTYEYLERIEVRGENHVIADGIMKSPKLKVVAYGENEIILPVVESYKSKVKLFGENNLTINSGESTKQTYKSYGENEINSNEFSGRAIKAKLYGEGTLNVNASEKLTVTAFGEADIRNTGGGMVKRKLVIGGSDIKRVASDT